MRFCPSLIRIFDRRNRRKPFVCRACEKDGQRSVEKKQLINRTFIHYKYFQTCFLLYLYYLAVAQLSETQRFTTCFGRRNQTYGRISPTSRSKKPNIPVEETQLPVGKTQLGRKFPTPCRKNTTWSKKPNSRSKKPNITIL